MAVKRKAKSKAKATQKKESKISIKKAFGIESVPATQMIPNMLTMMAMAAGISSIRYSSMGMWKTAVIAILLAAVFDGLDGPVARKLGAASKFGEEMDSLSDFVSFGVAPAFLMYNFAMHYLLPFGWIICLFSAICCGLRLARFNSMIGSKNQPSYWQYFFMGIPAPGGGLIVVLPAILSFVFPQVEIFKSPYLVGGVLMFAGVMMISRLPTLSLKKVKIPVNAVLPVLALIVLWIGLLITRLWIALAVMGILYLATVPVCLAIFAKLKKDAGK